MMPYEVLSAIKNAEIIQNANTKNLCTFKVGGQADRLVIPSDINALINAVSVCKNNGLKYFVLGKGSNVLFPDGNYNGIIISTEKCNSVSVNANEITAECGASLLSVCKNAEENSLSGLEFSYGIPGSVGGAVRMNAGAYGGEMKDVIKNVRWYDPDTNEIGESTENGFSYRHSVYSDCNKIVLSATFVLSHGDKNEIKSKMSEILSKRKEKQPLEYPSAGSTFKRPENDFASRLIDECGLKGCSIGGAEVSEKHAGFVINKNGATCDDVKKLVSHIKKEVYDKTGKMLECEIIFAE